MCYFHSNSVLLQGAAVKLIPRYVCRDVREFKSRVDAYSREMLRKESQIKDLQARLENGDGSKYFISDYPGLYKYLHQFLIF